MKHRYLLLIYVGAIAGAIGLYRAGLFPAWSGSVSVPPEIAGEAPLPSVTDRRPANPKARKSDFFYVGAWRGYRKGKKSFGTGTAELIHPRWALTAGHVASRVISDPESTNAVLKFSRLGKAPVSVSVKKAYGGLKGDMALLYLAKPVSGVKPVALLAEPITRKDGTITFTMAGHASGLHVHPKRRGRSKDGEGFYHSADAKGGRPGKAGDSGGAWVIPRDPGAQHVLFAVIHGGGKGPQVAPNKQKINAIMKPHGHQPTWVRKRDVKAFMRPGS